jgi:hypothetical protein
VVVRGWSELFDVMRDRPNILRAQELGEEIAQAVTTGMKSGFSKKNRDQIHGFLVELVGELRSGGNLDTATDAQLRGIETAIALQDKLKQFVLGRLDIENAIARRRAVLARDKQHGQMTMAPITVEATAAPVTPEVQEEVEKLKNKLRDLRSEYALGRRSADQYRGGLAEIVTESEVLARRQDVTKADLADIAALVGDARNDQVTRIMDEVQARTQLIDALEQQRLLGKATSQQVQQARTDTVQWLNTTADLLKKVLPPGTELEALLRQIAKAQADLNIETNTVTVSAIMKEVDARLAAIDALSQQAQFGLVSQGQMRSAARDTRKFLEAVKVELEAILPPGQELDALLRQIDASIRGLGDAAMSTGERIKQLISGAKDEWQDIDDAIVGTVEILRGGFIDAFGAMFDVLGEGSKRAGEAFEKHMLEALAQVAAGFGRFFLGKAISETAEGIGALANPLTAFLAGAHFKAAGLFTAAAAAMFTLSGALKGAASRTGASGSGGGGDRATENLAQEKEAILNIEGGFLDMNDPRQADALARALSELSGRRVIVTGQTAAAAA